jgi:hypothetical protein
MLALQSSKVGGRGSRLAETGVLPQICARKRVFGFGFARLTVGLDGWLEVGGRSVTPLAIGFLRLASWRHPGIPDLESHKRQNNLTFERTNCDTTPLTFIKSSTCRPVPSSCDRDEQIEISDRQTPSWTGGSTVRVAAGNRHGMTVKNTVSQEHASAGD